MELILSLILLFIILFIIYNLTSYNLNRTQDKKDEHFSIVKPFYNTYYPYTNPYSQCVEDSYGNTRCYAPSYYTKYLRPYHRRYPRRFRRTFRRYYW